MNLKLIFISLGLLLTELLTAQDQTTEPVIEASHRDCPYGISRCTDGTPQFPFCVLEL